MIAAPKVSMLRLQATTGCNLNCSYCYIPESARRQSVTMSPDVLDTTITRLIDEDLLEDRLTISWHGAEPLVAGLAWYKAAFARIAQMIGDRVRIAHVFQTNGVLLTDEWCTFLRRHEAHVGVSIDGPADQNGARVNWSGRAAFPAILRGVDRLNRHDIPWALLAVISRETMNDPVSFIRFVRSTGCATLGFKVEETNVAHRSALHAHADVSRAYADFVRALWEAFPAHSEPRVREFEEYRHARRAGTAFQTMPVTLIPLRNLTVAANGDFTIFSGELLFGEDDRFVFGNVMDGPVLDCLNTNLFRAVSSEILAGVAKCASRCERYSSCGSFYISQKYSETGSFDIDETIACRLEIKTLYNALDLASLET